MNKHENDDKENYAGNHEENCRDNSDKKYENYVQECKKSIDLGLYRDHFFLFKKTHAFSQNDQNHYNTPFL